MDTLADNPIHFDLEALKTRLGNNEMVIKQFIALISMNLDKPTSILIEDLRDALHQKDVARLHATAHKIKGTALSSSLPHLAELAYAIEKEQGLDKDSIDKLINEIVDEVALLKQLIPQ